MPVQEFAGRRLAIPVPLDSFPELRDPAKERLFIFAGSVEILPCCQQAFHEKRSLDQVSAVFEHAKYGHRLAGIAVHEVRPRAVISRGMFEKINDLGQPLDALLTRNKTALDADHEGHDAEAAGSRRDDAIVSGNIFTSHARVGICSLPVDRKSTRLNS